MSTLSATPGEEVQARRNVGGLSHSIEFGLLLSCCRAERHPESMQEFLTQEASRIEDWERVFELAGYHGVLPALHSALCNGSQSKSMDLRVGVGAELERRASYLAKKNLRLSAELIRILDCLDAAGVAAIPHKGPALAETIYGDLALRDFSDLDVLVRPADIPRAKQALARIAYRPNISLRPAEERAYIASGYEYTFDGSAGKNLLELQWNFVPRFFAIDFDLSAVFARAGSGTVAGRVVRTLAPEDLFLSLCVHAAKHLWSRLCWLRDIAAVMERVLLDWERVFAEARRLGIHRIVRVNLRLAHVLLGARFPEKTNAISAASTHDEQVQTITEAMAQHIAKTEDYSTQSFDHLRWMLRLRERSIDRYRYVSRLLITPSLGEWEWVKLPEPLFGCYRGVRLMRVGTRLFGMRR